MTKAEFRRIISICSSVKNVQIDILKNHDNNMWWPLSITDYRKRLLIAGLSTRVSYNMINTYMKVINQLNQYSFEEIKQMSKDRLIDIIKGLGLSNARYKYLSSMINFIDLYKKRLLTMPNNDLINLIAENVNGASYKVAQCCVLYIKGYYCGIMPVDSGMKDIELPCIGFNEYRNSQGHDVLRKQLEALAKDNNMEDIIKQNGYKSLNIPDYNNATWWTHLVLIYFKRHYCNKHKPNNCPLLHKNLAKSKCLKPRKIKSNI